MAIITTDNTNYIAIANAIRSKNGTENSYKPSEMAIAISDIKTSSFEESQTYSQINPVVASFLSEVAYDSSDYSTSQIESYANQVTSYRKDQPSGLDISVSSGEIHISDNYANRSFSETVNSGTYTIYNVVPSSVGGDYILSNNGKLKTGGRIIPTGSLRMIKCPNVRNVRDLGGWKCDGGTVKYGKLFRGGEVSAADGSVLVDFLGIKHDVNLRGKQEVTWTVSPLGKNVHFHVYDTYAWYSIDNSNLLKSILSDIFNAVIRGEPVYFHCSAGADRTGTIALILEALLGISQSDMDKDYELTCFYTGTENDANARRRNESEWTGFVNSFGEYRGDTFRDKVVSWVLSLGISIETINAFRSIMIDGTTEKLVSNAETYSVTNTFSNITSDNSVSEALQYQPYKAEIKPQNGFVIDSVSIKMSGKDITGQVWNGVKTNLNFSVKNTLTNCTTNNNRISVISGQSYGATIIPNNGYTLENAEISIKIGGKEVSEYYSNGKIIIPNVTGNIEINITAKESASTYINQILTSIDTDGNVIGLIKDKRYNSSDTLVDASGIDSCGFIPVNTGDNVRFKNMSFGGNGAGGYYCRMYDENHNLVYVFSPYMLKEAGYPAEQSRHVLDIKYDSNNDISQFTVGTRASGTINYIRLSWTAIQNKTAIITVNEEITD